MNPVETPMMQLMQAFGATSPQSVAAMFGIQGAAGDIQEEYSALFSGYLQSAEGGKPTGAATDIVNASKSSAQPYSAAPEDFNLALNPVEQILRPVALDGLITGEQVLAQISQFNQQSIEENELTPERLAAFALAVDYKTAQPVALTPENLQALQTALTEIQKNSANGPTLAPQPIAVQAPQSVTQPTGQFLPARELMYLFGQDTEIPAALRGDAPGLVLGGDVAQKQATVPPLAQAVAPQTVAPQAVAPQAVAPQAVAPQAVAPQATTQATSGAPTTDVAPAVQTTVQAPSAAPETASTAEKHPVTDAIKAAEANKLPDQTMASVATKEVSKIASTQKVLPDVIVDEADPEADGQVLTVTQKQQKPPSTALQTPQATAQTAPGSEAATSAIGAAATTPRPQVAADKTKAETPKVEATASADSKVANAVPSNPQPVVQAPARPTVDWTSPWTTPERAAGWADGTAAGLISSGLGSLTGQDNPMAGRGVMGGRPDPLLGKQVAKQVNVNITRSLKAGDNQFAMRMDPPELGRVAVKMTFLANGLVKAQVMAERPETLEMLQREVKGLERAVEAGGHKAEPGGISFSLDSGNGESAGKAFAEAMQEDRLNQEKAKASAMTEEAGDVMDGIEEEMDLDEILAHVTPETGIDVRV